MSKSNINFVFGSNDRGLHGSGAANHAVENYGAQVGVSKGPTGNAYAIPVKNKYNRLKEFEEVRREIEECIRYAVANPDTEFHVTRIGCGYNGFNDEIIAPLFNSAPSNVKFDRRWIEYLYGRSFEFWGTF